MFSCQIAGSPLQTHQHAAPVEIANGHPDAPKQFGIRLIDETMEMLMRRVELPETIKTPEPERQAVGAERLNVVPAPELCHGFRGPDLTQATAKSGRMLEIATLL